MWGPGDGDRGTVRVTAPAEPPPNPRPPPRHLGRERCCRRALRCRLPSWGAHSAPIHTPTPPRPQLHPNPIPTPTAPQPQPQSHPNPNSTPVPPAPPLTGFSPCLAGAVFLRCGAHRAQGVLLGAPALLWGRGGSRGGSQPHNLPAREEAEGGTGTSPAGAERSLRLYRENLAPWQDPSPTEGPQPHKWDPSSIVNPSPVTETKAA